MIKFIWAQDPNGLIGNNNKMPWVNSEEMSHFVKLTKNKIIVMGNNTYKAIDNKPLKNKKAVIVISRSKREVQFDEIYYRDIEMLLNDFKNEELWIIGGLEVFNLFSNYVDELHISVLNNVYKGDIYIDTPNFDNNIIIFNNKFVLKEHINYDSFKYYVYLKENNNK